MQATAATGAFVTSNSIVITACLMQLCWLPGLLTLHVRVFEGQEHVLDSSEGQWPVVACSGWHWQ